MQKINEIKKNEKKNIKKSENNKKLKLKCS